MILSKAIQKYGIKSFKREIIFYSFVNRMELYNIETDILTTLDARNDTMSYNMKNVGMGADPEVIGARFRGKRIPKASVDKQRKSLIDSQKVAGVNNPRSQEVICLDNKKIYKYARLAAEDVDGTDTGISEACNKGYKHRGKRWMFYEEYQQLGEPDENPRYTNSGKAKWHIVRLSDGKVFETATHAARFYGKSTFPEETFESFERTFAGNYWMKYIDWIEAGYPIRIPPNKHHNAKDRVVDLVTGKIYSSTIKCGIATQYNGDTVRNHCKGIYSKQRFMYETDWESSGKILIKRFEKRNVPIPVKNITEGKEFINMTQAASYEGISLNTFRRKLEAGKLINNHRYIEINE